MLRQLFKTPDDRAATLIRLTLGLVMLPHGAQKALGLFGGYGFEGTMGFFTQQMGIPAPFAFLAIAAEFAGSIGLIVGAAGRLAAFGIGTTMAVAVLMAHSGNGFFMNWYGNQKGEGFEYHLLAIGLAAFTVIRGSGAFSIDRVLFEKLGALRSPVRPVEITSVRTGTSAS